jgi:hypothetical protein
MKYFILDVHNAYIPPRLKGWFGILDSMTIKKHGYNMIPKYHIFRVEEHLQTVFTDVLMHPRFMLSKEAMNVVKLYMPFLSFEPIFLLDRKNRKSYTYYLPRLEEKEVLTKQSSFNLDRSVINHAQVDGDKAEGEPLIKVANVNLTCILIRSDLVESLLQRKMIGIGLKETDTIYHSHDGERMNANG